MSNSLSKETLALLQSPPVPVHFAGFSSDTYRLQSAGWQLSLDQQMGWGAEKAYRLALKHEPAKLYAISKPLIVPMSELYRNFSGHEPNSLLNFFKQTGFHIICMAPMIQFQIFSEPSPMSFNPIDAMPQWDRMSKNVSIEDIAIFRPISPDSEIVVHPSMVPELLEKIKAAQAPKQAEIRERKRREAMRQSDEGRVLGDSFSGYNPARDIKAQLVVVGE